MNLFRKDWTPAEADEWTIHDTLAVILSPLIYVIILIGASLAALLMPVGFILLAVGAVLFVIMIKVINPKLTAISEGYEKKQKQYIEELEKKVKWED
jgi:ABC-type multidrug transport system permease subunit